MNLIKNRSIHIGWVEIPKDVGKKILLFIISSLLLSNTFGAASAQTITLKERNVPLQVVMEKIRKQAKLDFIGSNVILKKSHVVSIDVTNMDIHSVLDEISRGQPVDFSLNNNTIVMKEKVVSIKSENKKHIQIGVQEEYELVGTVTDESGKPLSGVTVKRLNSSNWASTTSDEGTYTLKVSEEAKVLFSMVGYESQTVEVAGRRQVNVALKIQSQSIDEVVVNTGYSVRKKESMTGASTTITRKELEKFNTGNIFSVIQSVDPAFKVDESALNGSNPNSIPQITVRGTNSVGEYAVNAPLVILDGFEVSLERLYDLDVNRIESISLLKDASSTVLYGSRGGNGVLIVETRLPKDGKFTVTYEAKPSITAVDLSDYNLMNAAQKLEYERLAGVYTYIPTSTSEDPHYGNVEQTKLDNIYTKNRTNVVRGVDTYWIAQPVQTTMSVGHNIRVEGGGDQVRYSIDGNYSDMKGAMKESGRKRAGAGFNLIYRIPGYVTFRNNATFQSTKAYNSPYGDFSQYAKMNPYQPIYDEKGELIIQYENEFLDVIAYNPIYNASLSHKDYSTTTTLTDNFSVEWYINPHLIFSSKAVLEKTFLKGETYISPFDSRFLTTVTENKGRYDLLNGDGLSYYVNAQLTYARTWDKHALNGTVVGELNASDISQTTHALTGFATDEYVSPSLALRYAASTLPAYSNEPSRLLGAVATANYTYDQKYIVDLSYRMDGSSKFGRNERFGNFWSAGLGYNLHKEEFFKNDFVQELRLFANTGINGTDDFSARMTSTSYLISNNNIYFKQIGLLYNNEGNPDLRWPKIKQWSFGANGKMWDGRLTFSLSLYRKTTDQMVSLISAAPSLGLAGNAYYENMGKTQNKGFESSVSFKVFENSRKNLSWYLGASAVRNQSKLVEISEALRQLNTNNMKKNSDSLYVQTVYYQEGESLDNLKGVKSLGIDPASGREVFLSKNGTVTYNYDAKDMAIIGNKEPKLYGTVTSSINYKSLSIQAFFNYTLGGDVYNQTLADKIENIDPRMNADVRALQQRWKNPGDVALFKGITDETQTQPSSRFVQKENYFRFSALNINYDLPKELIQRYRLERLRLNFTMNDVFRISTVRMERGTAYPFSRTFNFGLMVQF